MTAFHTVCILRCAAGECRDILAGTTVALHGDMNLVKLNLFAIAALFMLAHVSAGCTTHLYSPPARLVPLESVATLPTGRSGIQVEGGGGGGLFGPSFVTGSLRVRRGLAERVEASLEGNLLIVSGTQAAPSARAGIKWRANDFLAFTLGVGGGSSIAGGFISPDLGVIVAYESRYFVPFLSARVWSSSPVGARTLTLDDGTGTLAQFRAELTLGTMETLGFRIPFAHEGNFARGAIVLGLSCYQLIDRTRSDGGVLLNGGAEYAF